MEAVRRDIHLSHAFGQICQTLESAHIPFIPLKGVVIRKRYPEPWMRTSCDIDVLVREEDLEQAINVLITELGCWNEGRGYHDVSLSAPNNVHVEHHFTLMEEHIFPAAQEIVKNVWKNVLPMMPEGFQMQMTDEVFYFYHILHMASHICGGCGIRPFLDLWLLNHKVQYNVSERDALLQKGGLLKFAQAANALSEVWFSGQPHTELTQRMEWFVLTGGMYGITENMIAVQQVKKGGRKQSILYKIFLPYELLKGHYPVLQRHKWLMPFCQMARWFRLLSPERWKQSVYELKTNMAVSKQHCSAVERLINELGL